MLVRKNQVSEILSIFKEAGGYGIDTETTGFFSYKEDEIFSLILADSERPYYFNFIEYEGLDPELVLDKKEVFTHLAECFSEEKSVWFFSNAKFDMRMLARDMDLDIKGRIHDTAVVGRILYNQHFQYGLDASLKRLGRGKDDSVTEYIKKHKLWTKEIVPGKKTKQTRKHFDKVPFDIISTYGEVDGEETRYLGMHQIKKLQEAKSEAATSDSKTLADVYRVECEVTKALFEMEHRGIQMDIPYIQEAIDYTEGEYTKAMAQWEIFAGSPFISSAKYLKPFFGESKSYDKDFMKLQTGDLETPAKLVTACRETSKQLNTYFRSFLYHCDKYGVIHTDFKQSGTVTGRMSCAEPNLQNQNKTKKKHKGKIKFPVRRAFVPREGYCFVMIDFEQMEYRLLLEYAQENDLIDAVIGGLDVHQAAGNVMDLPRDEAKNLNFGLVFGQGAELMAKTNGWTLAEAKRKKHHYFEKLPGVRKLTKNLTYFAANRKEKYVKNWLGRRCYFPDSKFAFRATNHIIQGGCADIMKVAMVNLFKMKLAERNIHSVLQIHDELLIEVHNTALHHVKEIAKVMAEAYKHKRLPMAVSIEHSWKSWEDTEKGLPKI